MLVTVKPRMHRETAALALHEHRPDAGVMIANSRPLDGEATRFRPHLLVRNDGAGPAASNAIGCRDRDPPQRRHGRQDRPQRADPGDSGQ